MKSRRLFWVILCFILATYPVAISFSHGDHDHGKEEKPKTKKVDSHDHGKETSSDKSKKAKESKEHDHDHDKKSEKESEEKSEKKSDGHEHGEHDDHGEEGVIQLTQESQSLGRIKTKPIESQPLSKRINVTGKVSQDPERTTYVVSKQDGVIKECNAVLGSLVRENDLLCDITGKDSLAIEIKSPANGVIIAELAKAGEKVSSTKPIFALADMSQVGVNFDIYEKDAGQVSLGQEVLVFTQSFPDKAFKGKIVFVSPRMDETSNTLRIKALIGNDDQALKLGMNVRGQILFNLGEEKHLTVPASAIQTVEGKTVVFVKLSKEEFEAKEIRIINQDQDTAAIEADIKNGAEVVVDGSFILKSKMLESEMEHSHDH